MERHRAPFSAIVGQEELKRALLTVAVDDGLDGLLVQGEKGTAKSTAVRGLVDLLPEQRAVADCPYGCPPDDPASQCETCRSRDPDDLAVETRPVPLVTLPLGATRERVVGTLSVANALEGEAEFDPGLLARANRGFLYVDEVNLLEDHLVDVLLDAAASGVNRVERDGVSVSHPADFTLIGTMNPEEGELRPQLRDRFSLQATVTGCRDPEDRIEIIDRALERNVDPETFADNYEADTAARRTQLREARDLLETVALPDEFKRDIAELCLEAGVDGHRGDIAIARTARTLAALDGRRKVIEPDVEEAARLALPHRLQSRPFEDAPDPEDVLEDHFDEEDEERDGEGEADEPEASSDEASEDDEPQTDARGDSEDDGSGDSSDTGSSGANGSSQPSNDALDDDDGDGDGGTQDTDAPAEGDDEDEATPLVPGQQRAEIGDAERPTVDDVEADTSTRGDGARVRARASDRGRGARVRTERATADESVDAAASVRAAATDGRTHVEEGDLRKSVRQSRAGSLIVFVVDASASMRPAMAEAKGTVMNLLQDAYEHRDEVAFVAVAGEEAEAVLPPTDSVTLAARHLKELPTGDRTPLPSGLEEATRLVTRTDADASLVVVVTDGRANVAEGSPTASTREAARRLARTDSEVVVVDAGDDGAGLIGILEAETGGKRIPLSELSAERVAETASAIGRGENTVQRDK
ncbi:ATP-binding protein [Natronobacterium texcoconense]|uniref:Protoporphyrin IX magnesium-chelatase n=1 Tax=Natronobacterium texcoconense TaxID=1095778 RepID=A0A1H1IFH6_NATTX|nr:ATP-binding protein [Natronobacterium texcoconense]SDR36118.1 protoporphyrin IX magnesium-chelatase [Natronobacterium texcoconense]